MIVAIVGSRQYADLDRVRRYVRTLPIGTTVVSGGAKGVDTAAVEAAAGPVYRTCEYLPDFEKYPRQRFGNQAYAIRNQAIVNASDVVVAFWDGISPGTAITLRIARQMGKEVLVNPEV